MDAKIISTTVKEHQLGVWSVRMVIADSEIEEQAKVHLVVQVEVEQTIAPLVAELQVEALRKVRDVFAAQTKDLVPRIQQRD